MTNKSSTNVKSASAPAKASTNVKGTDAPAKTATATAAPVAAAPAAPAPAPRVISGAQNVELRGTPVDLVKRGVRLNGKGMAVADFANLRKFHFKTAIDTAGYVDKVPGTKGKSAEIVQLIPAQGFEFSL